MTTYHQFLQNIKNAPRITFLAKYFEDIASGRAMVPLEPVIADTSLLRDKTAIFLYDHLKMKLGKFNEHCYASIPYALENCIRIMTAIYHYSAEYKHKNAITNFYVYEMGAGTGDITRILPEVTQGFITSLCSSATKANEIEFHKYKTNKNSYFYLGPYFNISIDFLLNHNELSCFSNGFDIIYERCTFQMYGADRENQIYHVSKILKDDGILILDEKFLNADFNEYLKREKVKDDIFKSKYFDLSQIIEKQEVILNTMTKNLVSLKTLSTALQKNFKHAAVIWNSTNFYTVVASNSEYNIERFIANMIQPCIPAEFNFENNLPSKLHGLEDVHLAFSECDG
ncbi:class I SAM-dependent methyltransferase [soil metagenome]